ncbi:hypothetical protein IscW_ISCW021419, partial [Ixodes scapularis]
PHLPHPGPGHLRPRRLPRLPRPHELLLSLPHLLHRCPRPSFRIRLRPRPRIWLGRLRYGLRHELRWSPIRRIWLDITQTLLPGKKDKDELRFSEANVTVKTFDAANKHTDFS